MSLLGLGGDGTVGQQGALDWSAKELINTVRLYFFTTTLVPKAVQNPK